MAAPSQGSTGIAHRSCRTNPGRQLGRRMGRGDAVRRQAAGSPSRSPPLPPRREPRGPALLATVARRQRVSTYLQIQNDNCRRTNALPGDNGDNLCDTATPSDGGPGHRSPKTYPSTTGRAPVATWSTQGLRKANTRSQSHQRPRPGPLVRATSVGPGAPGLAAPSTAPIRSPHAGDECRARSQPRRRPRPGSLVRATSVGPGVRGLAAPTTAPTWWPSAGDERRARGLAAPTIAPTWWPSAGDERRARGPGPCSPDDGHDRVPSCGRRASGPGPGASQPRRRPRPGDLVRVTSVGPGAWGPGPGASQPRQ